MTPTIPQSRGKRSRRLIQISRGNLAITPDQPFRVATEHRGKRDLHKQLQLLIALKAERLDDELTGRQSAETD